MRSLVLSLALLNGVAAEAQSADEMLAPMDLSSPEASVYSMMRAMFQADPEMIDQIFLPEATLARVSRTGEIRPDGLRAWRDWVGTLEPGAAHERLFAVTSEQYGPLATVWAPFVISLNGETVGCGVNTLTLARQEEDWRIVFGMDAQAPEEACATFETDYPTSD